MTSPAPSPRSTQIGAVLEAVVGLSRALARSRTAPFGDAVLTRTQVDILFLLARAREPVTPGQLAASLRFTRGAITQAVDHLRDQSLVTQSVSDHDARVRVLTLSDTARAQVAAFEAAAARQVAPWFADLSDESLTDLAELLARVKAS